MTEKLDYQGYPVKPRQLTPLAWFYEGKKGLTVLQQPAEGVNALSVDIPWCKLIAAIDRHFKAKRKRVK